MTDDRVWEFEESLWAGSAERYQELLDPDCLMVLPEPPFVMAGAQAVAAVSDTPRWVRVITSQRQVKRPQDGLIVVGYKVEAFKNEGKAYEAYCTSTHRRLEHGVWRMAGYTTSANFATAHKRLMLPGDAADLPCGVTRCPYKWPSHEDELTPQ